MSSSATLPSPRNTNTIRPNQLPFTLHDNSLISRNDSFASYLALVRDTHEFPPNITPTRARLHINLTPKRSHHDTEIDIFSAEKYFNSSPPSNSPPSSTTLSQTTFTTAEYSSQTQTTANSRNVLLPHRRRRTLTVARLFHLAAFGLWCSSCARKHAVEHKQSINKQTPVTCTANFVQQKQSINNKQSPVSWRIEASSPATWPAKYFDKEEDDRSESSSDLFEIESVGVSRAGYEPSEASIAWSVVTASAANVSVVSDRSEEIGRGRRRSSGLLRVGCTSHKAVEVTSPLAAAEVGNSISPVVARYHVDLEVGGGSGRIVAGRANGTSWHGGSGRIIV